MFVINKSREDCTMNHHLFVTKFQQLSIHSQSFYIYTAWCLFENDSPLSQLSIQQWQQGSLYAQLAYIPHSDFKDVMQYKNTDGTALLIPLQLFLGLKLSRTLQGPPADQRFMAQIMFQLQVRFDGYWEPQNPDSHL